ELRSSRTRRNGASRASVGPGPGQRWGPVLGAGYRAAGHADESRSRRSVSPGDRVSGSGTRGVLGQRGGARAARLDGPRPRVLGGARLGSRSESILGCRVGGAGDAGLPADARPERHSVAARAGPVSALLLLPLARLVGGSRGQPAARLRGAGLLALELLRASRLVTEP